jgi:hypothetical protein
MQADFWWKYRFIFIYQNLLNPGAAGLRGDSQRQYVLKTQYLYHEISLSQSFDSGLLQGSNVLIIASLI